MFRQDSLPNGNKHCHIYTDRNGHTNLLDVKSNITYCFTPSVSDNGMVVYRYENGYIKGKTVFTAEVLENIFNL